MKLFVIHKNTLIMYSIIFVTVIGLLTMNKEAAMNAIETMAPKKDLPIYSVQKDEKVCAISFDAAWGNEDTGELIKILEKYNVKTTFFVVGSWVDKFPESVKQLSDAGHEVMNHSDTHPHMSKLSTENILKELNSCNDKIEKITGVRPTLFRPPYGDYSNQLIKTVRDNNMYCIQWNNDSLDWRDLSAEEITKRVCDNISPGSIVLFHNAAKNTPQALPMILDRLTKDGYSIVPVSNLIIKDNYTIDHTGKQIPKQTEVKPME